MIVRTRNIPSEGLDADFEIPSTVITRTLVRGDALIEAFGHPVECHVHLDLSRKDVFVSGRAETAMKFTCARCGDEFEHRLEVDLSLTCSPKPESLGKVDVYQEAQDGLVFYKNDEIDLSEIVREQILLAVPMVSFCREECLGLCPACGANLNKDAEHRCASVKRR